MPSYTAGDVHGSVEESVNPGRTERDELGAQEARSALGNAFEFVQAGRDMLDTVGAGHKDPGFGLCIDVGRHLAILLRLFEEGLSDRYPAHVRDGKVRLDLGTFVEKAHARTRRQVLDECARDVAGIERDGREAAAIAHSIGRHEDVLPERRLDERARDLGLGAEVILDETLCHAGSSGDRTDRGTAVPEHVELVGGRVEDQGTSGCRSLLPLCHTLSVEDDPSPSAIVKGDFTLSAHPVAVWWRNGYARSRVRGHCR